MYCGGYILALVSRYDLAEADIAAKLPGQPAFRARQIWDAMYRGLADPAGLSSLPLSLRGEIASSADFGPGLEEVRRLEDDGGSTVKWLWRLKDGAVIETVLMLYPRRATVCVSSQAGCAMACRFCATGQAGFLRHLSRGEIVEQVVRAASYAKDHSAQRLSNVVFMGMGEPLANYRSTSAAAGTISAELGISPRRITISTVGIVPGIRRLISEAKPYTLAISLHSLDNDTRTELIPQNRIYGIDAIAEAAKDWTKATGRRVSLEWACMKGVNDRPEDAGQLARFARELRGHINLIPLNPTPGWPATGSSPQEVAGFAQRLLDAGASVTVRDNRGTSIAGACGQLAGAGQAEGTACSATTPMA